MSQFLGPILILVFGLSQAVRDVWFSDVFQGFGFFSVVLLVFALSSGIFALAAAVFARKELVGIWRLWPAVVGMNLTTALAWSCYFFGLKTLEPSVVNTIHSSMGPLTVLFVGLFSGGRLVRSRAEAASYAGLGLSVLALAVIVLSGASGLHVADFRRTALSLSLLLVSGTSITLSLMISKHLHDAGFGSLSVTAVRYIAAIVAAAALAIFTGQGFHETPRQALWLSTSGFILVALPTFVLQMGIARTSALTAQVIRSLSPVFVFAMEQFDPRIHWSAPVLAAILFYSACTIAANVTRGWARG